MEIRNINNKYLKYMINVLDRYGFSYSVDEKKDEEQSQVATNLSSQEFERYVERAMCEYESETMHNGRFVISYNELLNYKEELQREFFPDKNGMAYHILSRDQAKLTHLE